MITNDNINEYIDNDSHQTHHLKPGYRGIVCLNCTSYMCGLRDVWKT